MEWITVVEGIMVILSILVFWHILFSVGGRRILGRARLLGLIAGLAGLITSTTMLLVDTQTLAQTTTTRVVRGIFEPVFLIAFLLFLRARRQKPTIA